MDVPIRHGVFPAKFEVFAAYSLAGLVHPTPRCPWLVQPQIGVDGSYQSLASVERLSAPGIGFALNLPQASHGATRRR
jgi:hypothetical protein